MPTPSRPPTGRSAQPSPVKPDECVDMDISFGPSPAKPTSTSPLKPLHPFSTTTNQLSRPKSMPYTYTESLKYGHRPCHHRDGKENISVSSSDNSGSIISVSATGSSPGSSQPQSSSPSDHLDRGHSKGLYTCPIPSLIGPNDLPYAFNPSGINAFNFKDTNLRFDSLIWSDNRAALTDTAPLIEEHHHRAQDGPPSQFRSNVSGERGYGRRGRGRGARGSQMAAVAPIEEGVLTSGHAPIETATFHGLYPATLDAPFQSYGPGQWQMGIYGYPVDYRYPNPVPPPTFPPGNIPQSTLQPLAQPFVVGCQQHQPREEHQESSQHQRMSTAQRFATAPAAAPPSWTPPRPGQLPAVSYQPLMDLPPAQPQNQELLSSELNADISSANYTMSPEQGRWVNNLLGDASITESLEEQGLLDSDLSGDNMNGTESQELARPLDGNHTSGSLVSANSHVSDVSHSEDRLKTALFKKSEADVDRQGPDTGKQSPDQQHGTHVEADVFTA